MVEMLVAYTKHSLFRTSLAFVPLLLGYLYPVEVQSKKAHTEAKTQVLAST